jgi:hypothetical protein
MWKSKVETTEVRTPVISQPQPQPHSAPAPVRTRLVIARGANGQPRTYRLSPQRAQQAAYRRLAAAVLGLDVASLADQLRAARRNRHVLPLAA